MSYMKMRNSSNNASCLIRGSKTVHTPRRNAVAKLLMAATLSASIACPVVGCSTLAANDAATEPEEQYALEEVCTESSQETGDAYCLDESAIGSGGIYKAEGMSFDADYNTEEYDALEETGFVSTATSPLSTVSSDVDTASYCNLRRMIEDGYAMDEIPAGSVRIEEMLNYFDYDYEKPTDGNLFGTTVTMGPCPWNEDTNLLVMGFATADDEQAQAATEAGRNLVFLIDSSGSMDEIDKLPLLKESFGTLVDQLGENDRISIVTYSGSEEVLADGIPGNEKRKIERAMRNIDANGSTNGEAGLETAYELAEENYIEGGVNRIIMASDGDLNVGMTSESDLYDYVSEKRETGIYLSVLGFGSGNYKDNKMETLADNGNGQYHYIDSEREIQRVFGKDLTANMVPFADDMKIQIEFNPAQVKGYRLIGYENRVMEDEEFEDEAADAGDIGPNSQFTVAYEIVPVDSAMDIPAADLKYESENAASGNAAENSGEWATCTMRYKPVTGGNAEQQVVVSNDAMQDNPSADWEFAASVIEFGMLLRDSEYVGTSSIESVLELAESSQDVEERAQFADLVQTVWDNTNLDDTCAYGSEED